MKKLIFFLSLCCLFLLSVIYCGCDYKPDTSSLIEEQSLDVNPFRNRSFYISPIVIKEHDYILVVLKSNSDYFSVTHDPDCSKCKANKASMSGEKGESLFNYVH